MHAIYLKLAFQIFLLFPLVVMADDWSAGVRLPPIQTAPIKGFNLNSLNISLRSDNTTDLTYSTRDASSVGSIAFEINFPAFSWPGGSDSYPDKQFPELRVQQNTAAITATEFVTSKFKESDITNLIKQAKIDPWAIVDTPPIIDNPTDQSKHIYQKLISMGAMTFEDDLYTANWSSSRKLTWQSPSSQDFSLNISYIERPSFELLRSNSKQMNSLLTSFCGSKTGIGALGKSEYLLVETFKIHTPLGAVVPDAVALNVETNKTKKQVYFYCEKNTKNAQKVEVGILRVSVPQ